METLEPQSGHDAWRAGKAKDPARQPRTPPYTPMRTKRRFERSDSPASVSSIQPTETISPAKKAAKRAASDSVRVEELVEGDDGYVTDIETVYPEETEEKMTSDSSARSSDDTDNDSDTGISARFQQLGCDDRGEAAFEKKRRESHLRKRASSRLFKRMHSQTVKSDAEESDVEAMGDHDLSGSARRLRRRVRGPGGIEIFDVPNSSSEPGSAGLATPSDMQRVRSRGSSASSSEQAGDAEPMETE